MSGDIRKLLLVLLAKGKHIPLFLTYWHFVAQATFLDFIKARGIVFAWYIPRWEDLRVIPDEAYLKKASFGEQLLKFLHEAQ